MNVNCPKCSIVGEFGYFGEPDSKGIVAVVSHGKKLVETPFGSVEHPISNCFLREDDFTDEIKEIVGRVKDLR